MLPQDPLLLMNVFGELFDAVTGDENKRDTHTLF